MASSEKSKLRKARTDKPPRKMQAVSPEWAAFGKRIEQHREQLGISRPELAVRMKTTRMTVFRVEIGNTRVPLERIKDWAHVLKANPKTLAKLVTG